MPDNPRALIRDPNRYEPMANRTYQALAEHYGCAILPARPHKPQDKAKVEAGVLLVERWILARLRHWRFHSLHELNTAIRQLLGELNERPFQKLEGSRRSWFELLDRPALQPLPATAFEYADFKRARVSRLDYHVEFAHHYYSVPHALVGQEVELRVTRTTVEVLFRHRRVASHARSHRRGGYTTVAEHMPAAHRAHREWTPARLMHWAGTMGVATEHLVTHLSNPSRIRSRATARASACSPWRASTATHASRPAASAPRTRRQDPQDGRLDSRRRPRPPTQPPPRSSTTPSCPRTPTCAAPSTTTDP